MQQPSFNQYGITFDWNNDTNHPGLALEDNKVRVLHSKGQCKTAHGNIVLEPGNKYYWEVKLGHGTHFIIGIAPNPVPSLAKPLENVLDSSFDSVNSKQNDKNDNFLISIPEKLESQIKHETKNEANTAAGKKIKVFKPNLIELQKEVPEYYFTDCLPSLKPHKSFHEITGGYALYSLGEFKSTQTAAVFKGTDAFGQGDKIGVWFDTELGNLGFVIHRFQPELSIEAGEDIFETEWLGTGFVKEEFTLCEYVPAVSMLLEGEYLTLIDVQTSDQ